MTTPRLERHIAQAVTEDVHTQDIVEFRYYMLLERERLEEEMYFRQQREMLEAWMREEERRKLDEQKRWNKKFHKTRKHMNRQAMRR